MLESPRWRLRNAHYLNVISLGDGTKVEWEYKETSRQTGRQVRKLFPVPALLDPNDPADHNYPGDLIVAHEPNEDQVNTNRNEIYFVGEPTPEMEPLNEAAEALSNSLRSKWEHPIESLAPTGNMTPAESAFMESMMKAFAGAAQVNNQTVPKEQYDELKARLDRFEAQLAAANKQQPEPTVRRA